jgi:hypothetical protein
MKIKRAVGRMENFWGQEKKQSGKSDDSHILKEKTMRLAEHLLVLVELFYVPVARFPPNLHGLL